MKKKDKIYTLIIIFIITAIIFIPSQWAAWKIETFFVTLFSEKKVLETVKIDKKKEKQFEDLLKMEKRLQIVLKGIDQKGEEKSKKFFGIVKSKVDKSAETVRKKTQSSIKQLVEKIRKKRRLRKVAREVRKRKKQREKELTKALNKKEKAKEERKSKETVEKKKEEQAKKVIKKPKEKKQLIAKHEEKKTPSPPVPIKTLLIDSMEDMTLWDVAIEEKTVGRVALFRGVTGKGIAMYFDLQDNGWITITRTLSRKMKDYKGLRFSYYETGSSNSFELLLHDKDGRIYGKAFRSLSSGGKSWEMVNVLFDELVCLSEKKKSLDIKQIKKISFRVRKKSDDAGGKGRVVLDNLELIK